MLYKAGRNKLRETEEMRETMPLMNVIHGCNFFHKCFKHNDGYSYAALFFDNTCNKMIKPIAPDLYFAKKFVITILYQCQMDMVFCENM
jgi:hypothetical protein